ncbi:MAG: TerB family tellurite resistance protein [Alphaproteobacteria bacterium]
MIAKLKEFLFDREGRSETGGKHKADELHLAAAALLLEAALLDGLLDDVERDAVTRLVQERFGLGDDDTALIMTEAEKKARDAVEIHSFLRVLISNFDPEEQRELVAMLWDVICADGEIHDFESNLVRRVVGMTAVTDRESGAAKKQAMAKYGIEG